MLDQNGHFASVFVARSSVAERSLGLRARAGAKSYQYGGWRVDDAQYTLCRVPPPAASVEIGPWENALWDPMAIRPRFGSLDLVYPVNPKASKLVFIDGIVGIELDPLVKP